MFEQHTKKIPTEVVKPLNEKFQSLTAIVKEKYDVEIPSP